MEIRLVLRREACQKGTTRFSAMTITRRMNIVQHTRTPTATEHPRARAQTTEVMDIGSQIAVSPYWANSVDTSANIDDGQYYFGQRIGNATTC